jgi:hypothetical protein
MLFQAHHQHQCLQMPMLACIRKPNKFWQRVLQHPPVTLIPSYSNGLAQFHYFADKPSSSSASAAAAEASSSLLPQNAGSHSPTHHIGDGETSSAFNSWRIWEYECNDLPAKCPHCKTRMANMLKVSIG